MSDYLLDPSLERYVDQCSAFLPRSPSIQDRRVSFQQSALHFTPDAPEGLAIIDDDVEGVPVRLFRPKGAVPPGGWPTVMYLHGGGWMFGSHCTHDWFCYALCKRLPVAVVAVSYRLAPEHTFPAPLDDSFTIWKALRDQRWPELSFQRLAVVGDSAGGALAAGLCIKLRDLGLAQPRLQALAYPVTTRQTELRSMLEHAEAPLLETKELLASFDAYMPGWKEGAKVGALPLDHVDHTGLPPAFIGVAEFDPVHDHGTAYAQVLRQAGVPVECYVGTGMVHGCLRAQHVDGVEDFFNAMSRQIGRYLSCEGFGSTA
ncbi:alpha/beta hydrolase [Pseudomonas entomophila]|uniref:alpha/beta hydrolase n=1 Tax=Pseudomonas entomophila TaxID=312306 RepID=UPI003EBFB9B8